MTLPIIVHNKVASLDGNGLPVAGDGCDYQVINPRARKATKVRRKSDGAFIASKSPQRLNVFLAKFGLPQSAIDEIEVIEGETDTEFVNRIAAAHVPAGFNFELVEPENLPDQRWQPAWRLNERVLSIDPSEARKQRIVEIEREASLLTEILAKEHSVAIAKGDSISASVLQQKVQALTALDKATIEAEIAVVADLDSLDKHEPTAIKDAKQGTKT